MTAINAATIGTNVLIVRTVLESSVSGLSALKTLMDAIPTSNPSASDVATAVDAATVGTDVSAIKTAVEDATYGLSALRTLIAAVRDRS